MLSTMIAAALLPAQAGQIQTLRTVPINLPGFDAVSEHFQRSGLELKGVFTESSGSGSQDSFSSSSVTYAYFMGRWKATPVPSLGTYKGKVLVLKPLEGGYATPFLRIYDEESVAKAFTEADVAVVFKDGVSISTFSSGAYKWTVEANYIVKGDIAYMYQLSATKVAPASLATGWNPFIQSWFKINRDSISLPLNSFYMPKEFVLAHQAE